MRALQLMCAGVAIVALTEPATADVSKAWAAARDNLPANTELVAGFDVAAAVGSSMFAKFYAAIVKEDREIEEGVGLVKLACKVDLIKSVDGFVVGVNAQTDDDAGVVFVQLKGIDRPAVESCIVAVLKATGQTKATVQQQGTMSVLSVGGDSAYFLWVASDVVAISFDVEEKSKLTAWTGQRGAFGKSPLGMQLAKQDTKTLGWFAAAFPKPFDDSDLPVLRGNGNLTVAGGKVTFVATGTFDSAKTATDRLKSIKKDLAREMASKSTPPIAKRVGKKVTFKAAGADITVKVTGSEADAAELFAAVID